ncbi:MAG: TatD family hydrolase [Candidatus Thorarchaeota archaeon]|jgi:TatD DNase family protein
MEISKTASNVSLSLRLNPVKFNLDEDTKKFIENNSESIVAVGESGLDHFYIRDHTERAKQEHTFRILVETASALGIPIQVRSRSAGRVALDILSSMDADMVHMHAFDGRANLVRVASNEMGYYFSIPTSVVRSPQKQKLVKVVNIERLLLETDSPVLSPEKTTRNVPTNLRIALLDVARILRRDEEELAKIILENTLRLYKRIHV